MSNLYETNLLMKKFQHISLLFSILLLLGANNVLAGAGWWDNGGVVLTFSVDGSDVTRTLNNSSQEGATSLGTVTTGITLKAFKANVWRTNGSANICSAEIFYRVKDSNGVIVYDKSASGTAASWSSSSGNNQVWQKTGINDDLMNGGLAPGTYTFECWFKATGNSSSSSGCGTEYWYSKGGSNYTYTFIVPSKNLTVAGAVDGNTVSGSVTGITKGTAYTITATPTTGYTFTGWTATSGASSITIANTTSPTTTVTFNNYSNNVTVTASFVAEETHDVTVNYKFGSVTVKTSTTENAVGVTTARSFEAPFIDGYNFYSYTFGSGLTRKSAETNTNPCSFVTKSSGDYLLTVNYGIAPVKLLYGNSTPLNSPSNVDMTYNAYDKVYYVDITTSSSPFYFRFNFNNNTAEYTGDWTSYPDVNAVTVNGAKVACGVDVKEWENKASLKFTGQNGSSIRIWFSYKDKQAWITETTYTVSVLSDGHGTVSPSSVTAGPNTESATISASPNSNYIFDNWSLTSGTVTITDASSSSTTVKASSGGTITANFADQWAICGYGHEMGDWDTWMGLPNIGTNTFSGTFSLSAGTYYFKVVDRASSTWYTEPNKVITRASNTAMATTTTGTNNNLTLTADFAGTYTFTFNSSTKALTVIFPTAYTITYGAGAINGSNSAISTSPSFTSGDNVLATTDVTFIKGETNSGYLWKGWYSNDDGTGTCYSSADANWISSAGTRTEDISVYACYDYAEYSVTLQNTGQTGYGSGPDNSVTATYNSPMPTIAAGDLPTAASNYGFKGYWDEENGEGTQYYNADGTSAHIWDKTGGATLYAYYKPYTIEDIPLSRTVMEIMPATSGDDDKDYVIADAVIDPTVKIGDATIVCWRLLYSDGVSPVSGHDAEAYTEGGTKPNQVRFPIVGLAAGTYKIEAVLRTGGDCGSGTMLSTFKKNFRIANDYTVTIKYMCGDKVLLPSITQPGNPLDATDVTAPDIIGYKFKEWKAGEGITLSSDKTTKDNSYTAEYDATLTAIYEHKRTIYFNNTLGWSSVNVYFYKNNSYWEGSGEKRGSGANTTYTWTNTPYSEGKHGTMVNIEGTNIYYFDAEEAGVNASYTNVVFTEANQHGYNYFYATKAVRRDDYHSAQLSMFVPATGQTAKTYNLTDYYDEGYWVNYPENTGYTLKVYDRVSEEGAIEVASIPFEFTDEFTLSAPVDLALSETTTYGFKIYRADNQWFGNNGTMKNGNSGDVGQTPWEFKTSTSKCGLLTTAAGTYTFTLSFANKNGYNYVVGVHYPTKTGDFQVVYKDLATWSKGPHTAAWSHPSRVIYSEEGATDTVSFFISKGSSPTIQFRKVTGINSTTGEVSWGTPTSPININDDPAVEESGVYNIIVSQSGGTMSLVKIEKYTGPYYIRSGALNSKWGNYRNDYDHKMTYSAFSESEQNSFGEKFSHYKAKWCPRGTNVMFCIANDYSPCISDTLIQDYANEYDNIYDGDATYPDGELKAETYGGDGRPNTDPTGDMYSANIRFMWNWHTNKISRAYVASSTNIAKRFLVLVGDAGLKDKDGNAIPATANLEANAVLLHDDQNWIYESYIKVVPGTYAKLYACYTTIIPADAQYFRGDPNAAFDADHAIKILGGESYSTTAQKMRIIYDFKTNRLVTAWMPSGDITGTQQIEADAMIIRDHQKDADCITMTNDDSKLSEVRTVYGVMKFNRWTLNNRRRGPGDTEDEIKEHCLTDEQIATYHPLLPIDQQKSPFERQHYFISFPFDVNLSDVFGFGTYGEQWIISRYNGLRRAQQGYFADNCFNHDCTNWDYIHSELGIDHNTFVLKANEGYLLSLDLSQMEYNDTTTFWLNQIHNVELFFPSNMHIETIATSEATLPALDDEYRCKINHNTDGLHPEQDHTKKDSYWRCIGVPGYNDYTMEVLAGEGGETIEWQPHPQWEVVTGSLPFLYEWNTTDNSLTPRSTHPFHFRPTFAYLVQCSSAIYWQKVVGKPNTSSIVARRQTKTTDYTWRLTLEREGSFEDQTYIRMSTMEQVTDSFDFGQDLSKEPKYNHAYLYSFVGNEQVAANSMSLHTEETTLIPLGVVLSKADQAGDYTFALPDGSDGIGITLIDSLSGMRTNLSTGLTYTATLSQGTHNGRFWLEISPVQETPTALDPVTDDNSRDNVRKRMIDGRLYIIRDGRIYDARGTRVQ